MVIQSRTIEGSATAPANVIVDENITLVIAENASLEINFANNHLRIRSGAKVIIEVGGRIH